MWCPRVLVGRTLSRSTGLARWRSASNVAQADGGVSGVLCNRVYGQPVAATHPHLVNRGDLVPGVTREEFQERRMRLILGIQKFAVDNLGISKNCKHLVVIPSSTRKYMSDKIPYVYRQNSDFYYLSGCMEPDTVLVISIDGKSNPLSTLFVRPKDKHAEMWEGVRTGVDAATELFGVDEAFSIANFERELAKQFNQDKHLVWYDPKNSDLQSVSKSVARIVGNDTNLESPAAIVQGMRLFKSPAEQILMRKTCQIASSSINEVMTEARPGQSEHHIFAMVDYKCRMRNASHLAYPPVVASGTNATTIHYINNSQMCRSGDLILMDAGCEYAGYTSDITRTWPINGEFTEPQKVLYDVVLKLQKELIGMLLKEGGRTLDHLFDTMCFLLGKYLQEIGLVPSHITDVVGLTREGYKFCPHHVSHYLGMDVHDTPLIPRSLQLLPGMVCTVEPGVYIPEDRFDVPKEFRGIGIRVEDDVLITNDNTVEVLTEACKKERKDIENMHKHKIV